jgi:hypothetical protein
MAYAVNVGGVTLLTYLADWQNNSYAIDGENHTVKLSEKRQLTLKAGPGGYNC